MMPRSSASRRLFVAGLLLAAACALFATAAARGEWIFRKAVGVWFSWHGIHEYTADTSQGKVRYFRGGPAGAAPVVLWHGLGGDVRTHWLLLAPRLAERFNVIAPVLLYAEPDEVDTAAYWPWMESARVGALLDTLSVKRADMVGASLGGRLVLETAISEPARVNRLVLVAPAGVLEPVPTPQDLGYAPGRGFTRFFHDLFAHPPPVPEFILSLMAPAVDARLPKVNAILRRYNATGPLPERALGRLGAPVLLIWGEEDKIVPPRLAPKLAAIFPKGSLELLPDCGHAVIWDQPDRLADAVLEFFAAP